MLCLRAVHQRRAPRSGFSVRLLRAQYRAQPSIRDSGVEGLSMRAGLATLDVLENEDLGARALYLGETFRARLRSSLAGFEMVKEVRGMGLLSGIEFVPPKKLAAFHRVHPAMFGQIMVMRMFRE